VLVALKPGEFRLRIDETQRRYVDYLVSIAIEHPEEFGGINDGWESKAYGQLCRSLKARLVPYETIVLTKVQWEFLHTLLARAISDPAIFGGPRARGFAQILVRYLPLRGAGTH
jgi:hypothetical protein